jgi:hypothetical protein
VECGYVRSARQAVANHVAKLAREHLRAITDQHVAEQSAA